MGDSEYEITEEQRQAVLLMQQQQQMYEPLEDDEWDPNSGIFGEMDYSTFVSQRLKEVNAQWDKEPLPNEGRQKFIEFKQDEELTSVYQPPLYPSEGPEGDTDSISAETPANSAQDRGDNKSNQQADNSYSTKTTPHEDDQGGLSASLNRDLNINNNDDESVSIEASTTMPGEPLKSDTEQSKSKPKRKKKSLRFSADDSNDSASVGSSNSDDLDQHREINHNINNNNSSVRAEDDTVSSEKQSSTLTTQGNGAENNMTGQNTTHKVSKGEGDSPSSTSTHQKEERVLIEINGKFELVSVKELQAMGYPIPDDMTSETSSVSETSSPYSHHTRTSRPRSSVASRRGHDTGEMKGERQRARSANTTSGSPRTSSGRYTDWDNSGYKSPYALTPEQRELKERREKLIREREKTQRERKLEEDKKKKEEAESAFEWWLSTKKEEDEKKRENSVNRKDKEEEERAKIEENESAFNAWCNAKKEQQKRERLLKSREQKERDDAYFIRSRDECEQAYKRWLKNKKKDQRILYSMSASKVKSRRKKAKSNTLRPISSGHRDEWNGR